MKTCSSVPLWIELCAQVSVAKDADERERLLRDLAELMAEMVTRFQQPTARAGPSSLVN